VYGFPASNLLGSENMGDRSCLAVASMEYQLAYAYVLVAAAELSREIAFSRARYQYLDAAEWADRSRGSSRFSWDDVF
jgi:hypothetical protein